MAGSATFSLAKGTHRTVEVYFCSESLKIFVFDITSSSDETESVMKTAFVVNVTSHFCDNKNPVIFEELIIDRCRFAFEKKFHLDFHRKNSCL